MQDFINKFKIPTILGLGIIISGIITGVILTLKEQIFISQASPNVSVQNVTLSNISEDSLAISWQTSAPAASFITFGQTNPNEQVVLDDRDAKTPKAYSTHYVTIKNLLPKTSYQYKIISGKNSSETDKFTTASPTGLQTGFGPIIGSVVNGDKPLDEGIVYLSIADATTQSAPVKSSGNFLIPLSQIRKSDLSEGFPISEDAVAKLTVVSSLGSASALFKLGMSNNPLPALKLGQNIDFTTEDNSISTPSTRELNKYDLNEDGKINAADNAIILDIVQNFVKKGKSEQNSAAYKEADLNGDKVVDQKDLDLMAKKINQ